MAAADSAFADSAVADSGTELANSGSELASPLVDLARAPDAAQQEVHEVRVS